MMTFFKWACYILTLVIISGCMKKATYQPTTELQTIDNREMLVGEAQYADMLHYFPKWQAEDKKVAVSDSQVEQLKQIDRPLEIVCYLGTWCGDSRRGVPPFVRSLESAENPHLNIKMICVNREKDDPDHTALMNDIQRVPTFLIMENGEEIGRLIEFPMKENFVADFLDIVGNN